MASGSNNPTSPPSSNAAAAAAAAAAAVGAVGAGNRTSRGRRKIEMKKIESEDARHVTFSKRRTGVFNKASELATLCGVEIGIVVYSPAGRPYSFGQPSADLVFDRFLIQQREVDLAPVLEGQADPAPGGGGSGDWRQTGAVRQLSQQCVELMSRLASEKSRRDSLEGRLKAALQGEGKARARGFRKGATYEEIEELNAGLAGVKRSVEQRVTKILETGASSSRGPINAMGAPVFVHNNSNISSPYHPSLAQFSSMAAPPPPSIQYTMAPPPPPNQFTMAPNGQLLSMVPGQLLSRASNQLPNQLNMAPNQFTMPPPPPPPNQFTMAPRTQQHNMAPPPPPNQFAVTPNHLAMVPPPPPNQFTVTPNQFAMAPPPPPNQFNNPPPNQFTAQFATPNQFTMALPAPPQGGQAPSYDPAGIL